MYRSQETYSISPVFRDPFSVAQYTERYFFQDSSPGQHLWLPMDHIFIILFSQPSEKVGSLKHDCCWGVLLVTNESISSGESSSSKTVKGCITITDIISRDYKIYFVSQNWDIHTSNCSNKSFCQSSRTEEVRTKCFSRRLMSGVGNFK